MKECIPIKAIVHCFPHKKEKNNCYGGKKTVSWNIRPCNIDCISTEAKGSALDYMKGDFDHSAQTNSVVPVAQGQTYTLLYPAKSRDKGGAFEF